MGISALDATLFDDIVLEDLFPLHREIHDYWSSKKTDGRLPARADIDPVDIPQVLQWTLLLDVVRSDAQPRFKFRLFGTGLVERAGRDLTGVWIEDAFPEEQRHAYFFDAVARVVAEARPIGYFGHSMIEHRHHIRVRGLLFPLAADGRQVDMILGVNLRETLTNHAT